ncbi:hypothetical protein [Maritimibacter dapengensis]|uniref:HEAT repeat-containing protein n=1 Tax=Maritimibacter dapengensis TaxID=2836868 RepID=A0ABS6SXP4_9RHOB|nr:hypothetical protein [Maritimibacter dapengensis]MBV7377740.1 hypothetical protein [Maritimibacter dapengensis]
MAFGPYSRAGMALVFVPLYGGPVLAGMSAHPLATIPVFAVLFLAFMASTQRPNLASGAGWAGLAMIAAIQLLLAGLAYGAGALAALAFPLSLPMWLPLAVTGAAAGFGAWRYSRKAEMDVFIDSTIEKLRAFELESGHDLPAFHPTPVQHVRAAVDEALAALTALPETAGVGEIDPIVQALETKAGLAAFDPLYDAAGDTDGRHDRRVDLALLRFVASPRMRRMLVAQGEGGLASMLLLNAPDPTVRGEARARLVDLMDDNAPITQLPDPVWLTDLETRHPGEGFAALARARAALSKTAKTR